MTNRPTDTPLAHPTDSEQETYYAIALTRLAAFQPAQAMLLYRTMGSAQAVYEHRTDLPEAIAGLPTHLLRSLADWDDALQRAAAEMDFIGRGAIRALTPEAPDYPARLRECVDAPLVLYYRGTADLNQRHVINIVGTRHATTYGRDIVERLVADLHRLCPGVLVVSGLAYGIDITAHRAALAEGLPTVGVLAHGLDQIYPPRHRDTAAAMVRQGGLLTEYMSLTQALPNNFRQRNRIVAGMSDATILVESAVKGGGLITCRIAQDYGRDVFAFPGAVGMPYSEGCNQLIRRNTAGLITSATDFLDAMGWQTEAHRPAAVERQLFPDLTPDEQQVVDLLQSAGDMQLNQLCVQANQPIGQLSSTLFSLEMKGLVRPLAGGAYHLLH